PALTPSLPDALPICLRLGILGFERELDELAAQALDLLLDDGPGVVGLDDGAEAFGRADGLQAGDAGADDEDACRRYRAGRRHEQDRKSTRLNQSRSE